MTLPAHSPPAFPDPPDWPHPLSRYVTQPTPWWLSQAWAALTRPVHHPRAGWTEDRVAAWLLQADAHFGAHLDLAKHDNDPDLALHERPSVLLGQVWNTLRCLSDPDAQPQAVGTSAVDLQCLQAELLVTMAKATALGLADIGGWPLALAGPPSRSAVLPVLLVFGEGQGQQGVVYSLRLALWHRPGAALALVPSPAQQCVPTNRRFAQSLRTVEQWLRQTLASAEGQWRDWALVWDLVPEQGGCHMVCGPSASAALALGCLWLLRDMAPPEWQAVLHRLQASDLARAYISAELRGGAAPGPLAPVGGARAKDGALAVVRQVLEAGLGVSVPLRTALGQAKSEGRAPVGASVRPALLTTEHADLLHLAQALAEAACPLTPAQEALRDALRPALAALARPASGGDLPAQIGEAGSCAQAQAESEAEETAEAEDDDPGTALAAADWPYPAHRPPRLVFSPGLAEQVQALADPAHEGRRAVTQPLHYALQRWAFRARRVTQAVANRLDGDGQMHRRFVRLQVSVDGAGGEPRDPFTSLESLMLSHEGSDPLQARARVQAYLLIGDPGAGKSWLMGRHEQALCEQLIWADLQPASRATRRLVLPVYLPLKDMNAGEDPVAFYRRTVQTRYPLQAFGLLERADPGASGRSRFALRLLLDGLNELRLRDGESAEARAREVVHSLQAALAPELPLVIGTRTHHAFVDLADTGFRVARIHILRWGRRQIRAYLRQRWGAGSGRIAPFMAQLDERPGVLQLMGLPLYLATQCELIEAGARQLVANRAHLLAAMLWLRLNAERQRPGSPLARPGLLHAEELRSAEQFARQLEQAPDQAPPPFPRRGALLRGLFAQAKAQWLWEPSGAAAEGRSRGGVSVPWTEVQGTLGALGLDEDAAERWLQAVQNLGLAERSDNDRFSFSHQVFGEWAASQQLFYSHAQGLGRLEQPRPGHWRAPDLLALRAEMLPPALTESAEASLARQRDAAAGEWEALPGAVKSAWLEHGSTVPWERVQREEPPERWSNERWLQAAAHEGLLTRSGDQATWHWRAWGNFMRDGAVFHSFEPQPDWAAQAPAWPQLLTNATVWGVFQRQAQAELAEAWREQGVAGGAERARALWQQRGQLGPAPPGRLDDIVPLALLALADPWPWLRWLMGLAPEAEALAESEASAPLAGGVAEGPTSHASAATVTKSGVPPVWALAARCLADEGELMRALPGGSEAEAAPGVQQLLAHTRQALLQRQQDPGADLRLRLQAGEALGSLGPLGARGDSLRFERAGAGARLRWDPAQPPLHWLPVGGPGQRYRLGDELRGDADERPHVWWASEHTAWLAAYPVTVGEYQAFVVAGGYDNPEDPWWNPPDPAQPGQRASAGARWLRQRMDALKSRPVRPYGWGNLARANRLLPVVGLTWYEALAYCQWAAQAVYADRLAWLSDRMGRPMMLRLPTEREWEAAVRGPHTGADAAPPLAWPGHPLDAPPGAAPAPLLFNHLASGWGRPSPVGAFERSRPGAPGAGPSDAAGNVREWCANRYLPDWSDARHGETAAPSVALDRELRALRGGSCSNTAARCRVGNRDGNAPGSGVSSGGFRLVLAVVL